MPVRRWILAGIELPELEDPESTARSSIRKPQIEKKERY
jgi:hypothetical protein